MELSLFDTRELAVEQEITSELSPINQRNIQSPLARSSIQNVIEKIIPKQRDEN